MTSKQPVTVVVAALAAKLQLTPEAVDKALHQLEQDGRISQTIKQTIVQIVLLHKTYANLDKAAIA
jgi:DNA-binding transcriptional regulator YhcF (GntR family)